MRFRKLAAWTLAALLFVSAILFVLAGRDSQENKRAATTINPLVLSGLFDIRTMADIRVAGRKVVLCGVSFDKPAALEPLVREQARRTFQRSKVDCIQVGGGTPCDGRAAPVFENMPVVQCRRSDGSDIAHELSDLGYLCDVPTQSGGAYRAC
jgi:hypothetical protein